MAPHSVSPPLEAVDLSKAIVADEIPSTLKRVEPEELSQLEIAKGESSASIISIEPLDSTVDNNTKISYSSRLHAELQPVSKPRAPLRTIFPALELEDHPIDDTPSLKAIVVGAGISGINAGILLPIKVPGIELVIYEKASDIVS